MSSTPVDDDGAPLSALDGDEGLAYEFKIAFADLSGDCYSLLEGFSERYYDDNAAQEYNDCTVALVGDNRQLIGYDSYEQDYYRLGNSERG